jgi:hypothetical protein
LFCSCQPNTELVEHIYVEHGSVFSFESVDQ